MSTEILNYKLSDTTVTSGGSHPLHFDGAEIVRGPGRLGDHNYPKALKLGGQTSGKVDVSDIDFDAQKFRIRVVFKFDEAVEGRQNLVESDKLPFSLFLSGATTDGVRLTASVKPSAHGWRSASTLHTQKVALRRWHVADLVYDFDTLGLFLDGRLQSVQAFPDGTIQPRSSGNLLVGAWVDGRRNRFTGSIAAVHVDSGIPVQLESELDQRRNGHEWHITHKANLIRPSYDLGRPERPAVFRARIGAWYQRWSRGAVMYRPSAGSAFVLKGAILNRFEALRDPDSLGYLVSDERRPTDRRGVKSVFSSGAIYWSPQTGAHPVTGQMYLSYEDLGESKRLGFPTGSARSIGGGRELRLERARMYHRRGTPRAFEVHGAILGRLLATGGVARWGFPVSDEMPIQKGGQVRGQRSEFERATFYWSRSSGAHEVHGDIERKFKEVGGPLGELGFPLTDELGIRGGRASRFQNGTLCWYGRYSGIVHVRPFKLFIGTINSRESEGWLQGQNDLYIRVKIKQGSRMLHEARYPRRGSWGGRNVRDVNIGLPVVVQPDPTKPVTFEVRIYDEDDVGGGKDDKLGTWTKSLDAGNAWGLRERNGVWDSGRFSKINNIRASHKPQGRSLTSLTPVQRSWGVENKKTPKIPWSRYAQAFRDVDSQTEWWDVSDWLQKLFFEVAAEGVASGGNCFGMALETTYANKDLSPFAQPVNRFGRWSQVEPTFNVKHQYQIGAAAIWWFVGEVITGNTHDPRDVFRETRQAHARGDDPVLCLSQNYDFSGKPHCVLPVGWDASSNPWRITVYDPNSNKGFRTVHINPTRNTFHYEGTTRPGERTYKGGQWSGGRLHYMPWSVLNRAPRTPTWEAILLLLAGVAIIVGDGHSTSSITDQAGNDLDGHGRRATGLLKAGDRLDGHFVSYKGVGGTGTIPGELLMTTESRARGMLVGRSTVDDTMITNTTVEHMNANARMREVRDSILRTDPVLADATLGTLLTSDVLDTLDQDTVEKLVAAAEAVRTGDYVHTIRADKNVALSYGMLRGLEEVAINGSAKTGDTTKVRTKDTGSSSAVLGVTSSRQKDLDVTLVQKRGISGDKTRVKLSGITAAARREFLVDPKPGLGAIDLVGGTPGNVRVQLTEEVNGRQRTRQFTTRLNGGMRLTLSPGLNEGRIGVSEIDELRGSVIESTVVDADG